MNNIQAFSELRQLANAILSEPGYKADVQENVYDRKRLADMVQFRIQQVMIEFPSNWGREYSSNRVYKVLNCGAEQGFSDMRPNEIAAWAAVLSVSMTDLIRIGAGCKTITIDEAKTLLQSEGGYIEMVAA